MFSTNQYALLDFGEGRKLERFGAIVLDRPSPAATNVHRANPELWSTAAARFVATSGMSRALGQRGEWAAQSPLPATWTIAHPPLLMELRLTEFGHVGVFPEQAENWSWIARQVGHLRDSPLAPPQSQKPARVLNLFAHTGASTLAAAAAGADVVHIDASKSTVAWARRNADLSGLASAPIRWIVEDAVRFVAREAKRGSRYHGMILDPPSYGHGPKGNVWQVERDLPELLNMCGAILAEDTGFMLLTCHSAGIRVQDLARELKAAVSNAQSRIESNDLFLTTADGRRLHSGIQARWSSTYPSTHLPGR